MASSSFNRPGRNLPLGYSDDVQRSVLISTRPRAHLVLRLNTGLCVCVRERESRIVYEADAQCVHAVE